MRRSIRSSMTLTCCAVLAACGSSSKTPPQDAGAPRDQASSPFDAGSDAPEAIGPVARVCKELKLTPRAFRATGPHGTQRHTLAQDFTLALQDGRSFTLSQAWTGCESYVFLPDTLRASARLTAPSVWERDLSTLVQYSPKNAHYFFVGRSAAARTGAVLEQMQARVDGVLAALDDRDREHWQERLHVVASHVEDLSGWLQPVLDRGIGRLGLAIDRFQRLRGVGSLADVKRYSSALQAAELWPWEANLAYAAHEVMYYNFEAERQARLDAATVTEVKLWSGEVIEEFAEMDATLPDAATLATFDTLELDVTQRCPDAEAVEPGNCGAWDYISSLSVQDAAGGYQELARLITTYHREGRWVVDMSPMLVHLAGGGTRRFKWSWAPPWNKQPTATWLSLRLSNRDKGIRPTALVPLFDGGPFDAAYNEAYADKSVSIPAGARKVELWAIISGHGQSATNCAEFCNHEHVFGVNGTEYRQAYPGAGTKDGCLRAIADGVVPNQWGTWWLGRGGWCPGQQVSPFTRDITAVAQAGKEAIFSYRGAFRNGLPPEESEPGNINMKSYVVIYQ